jgi:hypothetical protein
MTGAALSVRRPANATQAPSAPASAAATKHARQSMPSTSAPPTAVPSAKPAIIAVTGHVYASVTAPGGATCPTSWLPAAPSGAISSPAGTISSAITATDGAASAGRKPSGSSAARRR